MTDLVGTNGNLQADPYVRIKAEKISLLLDLTGELGLAAAAVTHHPALIGLALEGFQNEVHRLENLIRDIQDQTSGLRMVPAGQLLRRMQRLSRDLVHQTGKAFDLSIVGEEIEVDKILLDQLSDPLIHLIRNAADHGLEDPEERVKTGKPVSGLIQLIVEQRGKDVLISVRDDGRGLDRDGILKQAIAHGLVDEKEKLDDDSLWKLIFLPGFSTVKEVSTLSGRGVGMDIVQTMTHSLRGRVLVETQPGQGTMITLVIPLTLAFQDCMVVESSQRLYAIPIDGISEVFSSSDHQVFRSSADGCEMANWHGDIVPIRRFSKIFQENGEICAESAGEEIIVVVNTAYGRYGLPVEKIIGQQQVVLKPLTGVLQNIHAGAGCALLSNGEVAMALDIDRLFDSILAG
jgi:two-component system, chemotaxis family, sensor kinase CheA